MTTRALATTQPGGHLNGLLVTWTGLTFASTDDGTPYEGVDFADRTVQIDGSFGTGGSITLEGSNDGVKFFPLTDPQGNAITKTTESLEVIAENPRFMRPRVTAGDGSTSLNVRLWLRRAR